MSAGVSLKTQHKAEQFLYRQAEILDDRIWDDWLALFTAEGHYWMPATPEQTEGEGQPNIFYEDHNYQTFDTREYEDKIVKVIVRKKTNAKKFEKFIDKLYNSNVYELKVVENFQLQESEDFEAFESEDTLSILNRYVEEAEMSLEKSRIQEVIREVYQEACELV